LPKGHTNNPAGKPVGTKNRKTLEWEAFGKDFTSEAMPRVKDIMARANNDDYMKYFAMLIEYFQPKLARTELTGTEGNDITIKVIYEGTDGTPE